MRLLFDEQLSERLTDILAEVFPDSAHVRPLLGTGAGDERVWRLAADLGCLLVTKDEDFHRLSVLRGAPPKVVWVRTGNCTTEDVVHLLRNHADDLRVFADHPEATFLAIGGDPL